ncbi:MAG: methyl-accepting chemotaxis protein [Sporolactobacillus sp.]|jgi:methyl-accepting chemotaxis protein|nr:methyl-accepting chemotaxis protein [Sporolactobacillus sp.]
MQHKLFVQWNHLKINQKYLLNLLIILCIILLAVAASAWLLLLSMQRVNAAGKEGDRTVQITEIGTLFRSKDSRVVDYLLNPGDSAVKLYSRDQSELTKMEKKIQPFMRTPEQKKLFTRIMHDDSMTYNLFQNELVPAVLAGDHAKTLSIRHEQNRIQNNTMTRLQQLRQSVVRDEQAAVRNARAQINLSIFFLITGLILSVLIGGALTFLIQRRIKRQFRHVVTMTKRIASGDLRRSSDIIHSRDELGLIAQSIVDMKDNLLAMTRTLSELSQKSRTQSQKLIGATHETARSSNDIRQSMEQLSVGVEEQAKHTSAVSEMAGSFLKSLEKETQRAQTVNQLAEQAAQATQTGRTLIDGSIHHMTEIGTGVKDCRTKMERLGMRLKNITELIDLIRTIARQTNLLALNASIVAAKAGEKGREFNVIADAIRKLSNQTADSVGKIVTEIGEIHEDAGQVAAALDQSSEQVDQGSAQIHRTGRQFGEIARRMTQVRTDLAAMNDRFHEVGNVGRQMIQAIENIASVSEESAANVNDVTQSVGHVDKTMSGLLKEAESLEKEAQRLNQLIGRFKLQDTKQVVSA